MSTGSPYKFSISWVFQGASHYAHTDDRMTATIVARSVSADLGVRTTAYQGTTEVASYRDGEIV